MRRAAWICGALAALVAALGLALWLALPAARPRAEPPTAIAPAERAALLAALRPPKRARPLVAVLGNNGGSETTDFVVPLGVLREADVADVVAVGMSAEPIVLMPALRVRPDVDAASFDASHPDGADYVIVPALHRHDDPAVLAWLRAQAKSGALVIGICEGARVLGAAGLLDGHSATTHWFSVSRLRKAVPSMTWTADRRYVADRGVATTTGVSASLPLALTLVEAIAGRERADAVAARFGVPSFGAEHASREFALDRPAVATLFGNTLAVWRHESLALPLADGVDEVALALTADAWTRTYRAKVETAGAKSEVTSARGLVVLADRSESPPAERVLALPAPGASALDAALDGIGARYGAATADLVALQLEYDRR
jgi:putative intracellular protease/amidase